jgi:type IV pilus secretin PilQ/predicted competence protein
MRMMRRAWGLGALIAAGLILTGGALRAGDAPLVHVKAVVADGGVRLEAQANGPFEYTEYRASDSLYVLDLDGVSAADPAGARVVASDLVKGYRVVPYVAGDKPVVRVEILLSQGVAPRIERKDAQDLTLLVSRASTDAAQPGAAPTAAPEVATASTVKTDRESFGVIRRVNLVETGGQPEVDISGSTHLTYRTMRLRNPERLVLDFTDARIAASEKHIASNLDPIREVRLAQFTPLVSRVVIDLREPAAYQIRTDGNNVVIAFAPVADDRSNGPADGPDGSGVKTAATAPASVPAPAAVLPVSYTQPSSALASPARPAAPMTDSAPAAPAAQPQNAAQAATTTSPKYTGEPISVNLKDVDLRDFFRLIHEISGLNVVVDPSVKGNLTIVLDDVPWDQALDIVLQNNDLDKQLNGNVLRIATKDTLRKEAEESRDLAKAQAEAAEVITTTRVLSYAKATDLAPTLKKFLSSRGDIISDDRSNTLIIRDIPSTLPVIDNLIRQLDRRSQQVEIEARVVEASRNFARDIGTQFGVSAGNPSRSNLISGGAGASPFTRTFATPTSPGLPPPPVIVSNGSSSGTPTSGQIPLMSNLPAATPTSGLSYNFTSTNFALDMIITAAESRGVGKLLSKPKIITQNNEKATVKQGVKIPVQTIVNNTVSVQFVDAVLELDVTPQITADGTVYMDVTVENDQIDQSIPRVEGIPAIDTQSAETKVTVNDGATVVIGGVIVTQQSTNIQQVPLVGSVPLLGNLFKRTTVSSSSSELLFFLTPRILPT